ncbi:hypothetical protein [Salsuginibacillus kocurii]|uniref:hypothetical protein n=1 Tax=Salsuginibacillus kocurii TaxID=427078 RepID=UPI00037550F5|nr:hypothetical protein [Salsuginibacillus kocurii]
MNKPFLLALQLGLVIFAFIVPFALNFIFRQGGVVTQALEGPSPSQLLILTSFLFGPLLCFQLTFSLEAKKPQSLFSSRLWRRMPFLTFMGGVACIILFIAAAEFLPTSVVYESNSYIFISYIFLLFVFFLFVFSLATRFAPAHFTLLQHTHLSLILTIICLLVPILFMSDL